MNDVAELKSYGLAHARAQNITEAAYREVCGRIDSDDRDAPGSWTGEWSRAAARLEAEGRLLEACGYYNLARFPAVDGPARAEALRACVRVCADWAAGNGVVRLELPVLGETVPCWASGLDSTAKRPLLLVMGGIISIKEQWMPLLGRAARLGMAVLVAELPGVGENPLTYGADSWRMIPRLLDAVADSADVQQTYGLTLSFSGHAALRSAVHDPRIRGVITIAAPVSAFFTDPDWRRGLPALTVDTLARLTRTDPERITGDLSPWALTDEELAALDIPIHYLATHEDAIIPGADVARLRSRTRRTEVLEYRDAHAGPGNATETRVWIFRSLLRMRGVRGPLPVLLSTAAALLRLRRLVLGLRTRRTRAAVPGAPSTPSAERTIP
ncbi:alpha/beta hydrolase [Kitasatospora sp. NPDC059673]|uniref:alpha/beta hydrolase n=1 Tax=Kitasatospora sp. NPDC059673 TaxID=3346901 RepID=UPI003683449C